MANETTTKFKVDISELKAGIQEANRQIALANSEFKQASAGMEKWSQDADGLSAKLTQLKTVTGQYENILGELQGQYEKVVAEQGENSQGAVDLKIKINSLKGAIKQNNAAIERYETQLESVKNESDDSRTSLEKLNDSISDQEDDVDSLKKKYANLVLEQGKNSKEAKQTAKEIEKLSKELADNKKKVTTAEKAADDLSDALDDVGDSAEGAQDGFTVLKGALSTFAGNVLTGVANGIKDIGSSILGLGESTREYRGLMNKLDAAAKDSGMSTDFVKKKYEDLYGVLGDETAAQTTISNFLAMDASGKDLNKLIDVSTGIWAKYGDSIPLDGLAESINETKRVGAVTGGLADALNWAGISEDEFNKKLEACSNEQERQQLIIETLDSAYGDISDTYQKNNKDIIEANKANARYQEVLAEVGAKVEPVTTALKNGFSGLLEKAMSLVDDVDMSAFTEKIEQGFTVLTNDVLPAVKDGFGWILDHKDELIAGLAGIAAGFVAFKVVSIIQSVTNAMKGMTLAQAALNLVMNMNPISLVVSAIAGLVTAFVVLWNKSESFRQFWIDLWEKIKTAGSTAIETITTFFSGLGEDIGTFLSGAYTKVVEWAKNMITKAKESGSGFLEKIVEFFTQLPGKIGSFFTTAYSKAVAWANQMVNKAKDTGTRFLNNIVTFFTQLPGKIWTFLTNAISKVTLFATGIINKAKQAGSDFLNKIIEYVTQLPGKVWTHLSNVITKVTTFATRIVDKAKEAGSDFLNKVIEYVKQLPGKTWTWLNNTITKAGTFASDMLSKAKQAGSDFVDKVIEYVKGLPGKVADKLTEVVDKVVSWGSDMMTKGQQAAQDLLDTVVAKIKEIPGKVGEIGSDIVEGLWNGINDMGSWIGSKIQGFGDSVLSSLKNFFGIHSPSRVFRDEIGKNIVLGIAEGIGKNTGKAVTSIHKLADKMLKKAKEANGNYTEVGQQVIEKMTSGVNSYADKAVSSVKSLINKQVKAMTEANKKNKSKYESAGKSVIEAYESAMESASTKAIATLNTKLEEISASAQEKYDRVADMQASMNQMLAESGELYEVDEQGNLILRNLENDINDLNQYNANLSNLRGRVSESLMDEITQMGIDEALAYSNALLSMTDAELAEYNRIYNEKQALASSISSTFYADRVSAIKSEYTEKVESAFAETKTKLEEAGKNALDGFVDGMTKGTGKASKAVKKVAKSLVKAMKKALKINSPSKVFEELGIFSGLGYRNGFVETLESAKKKITSAAQFGLRTNAGVSGGNGSVSNVYNYNFNQTNNSPKALSRLDIYRQTRNQLKQVKGGVVYA